MPIPLVVLTGFLGAGKTTFLQRLVPALAAVEVAPRILLNDHRNAAVDAARLSALTDLVTPLNGDCVCCGSREELFDALLAIEPAPRTVLLLEANGTTDAEELLAILTLDDRLSAFALPTQVAIVDAKRWQHRYWNNVLEEDQVATASHVWVNWTEGATARRLLEVESHLVRLNAGATRTTPEGFASILASLVTSAPARPARRRALATLRQAPVTAAPAMPSVSHAHQHHFASWEAPLPALLSRPALLDFVRALPSSVTRAKGIARLDDAPDADIIWSRIGGGGEVYLEAVPTQPLGPLVLCIGARLPSDELEALVTDLHGRVARTVSATPTP